MLGNVTTKVLEESSNVCNKLLRGIWNFEKLEKENFPQTLKLKSSLFGKRSSFTLKLLTRQCTPYCI